MRSYKLTVSAPTDAVEWWEQRSTALAEDLPTLLRELADCEIIERAGSVEITALGACPSLFDDGGLVELFEAAPVA